MPEYDTECRKCAFMDTVVLKIADLSEWDAAAICPSCQAAGKTYLRVIKRAPAMGSGTSNIKGQIQSNKESFVKSGQRDTMRHEALQKVDKDQKATAREIVKHGVYEGF